MVCFLGYFYEIPSIGAIRINTQVCITPKRFKFDLFILVVCSCLGVCEGPRMTYIGLLCVVHCCLGISRCFEQADGPCRCKTSAVDQRLPGCSGTTFFNKRHRNPLKCYMLHCSLCSLHDLRSWA